MKVVLLEGESKVVVVVLLATICFVCKAGQLIVISGSAQGERPSREGRG